MSPRYNFHPFLAGEGGREMLEKGFLQPARPVESRLTAFEGVTTIAFVRDADLLGILIEDGGAGFDPEATPAAGTSRGLTGMRERAGLLGGQLFVDSTPGEGTD